MTWDAEVDVGYTAYGVAALEHRFFGRGRAGVLIIHEPYFVTIGGTVEGVGLPRIAGGIEAGVSHLWWGLWVQGGVAVDLGPDLFFHLSAGFTLLGVEWQRRVTGDPGTDRRDSIAIVLRLPIGIYAGAM